MGTYNDIDSLGIARLKAAQELQAQQQKAQQKPSPIPPPYMNMDEDVPVIPAGTPETYTPIEGDRSSASDETDRSPASLSRSKQMADSLAKVQSNIEAGKANVADKRQKTDDSLTAHSTVTNTAPGWNELADVLGYKGEDGKDHAGIIAAAKALAGGNSAYIAQEKGIADQEDNRKAMYAQPLGLNLQPAYNTLDALYGTKTAKNYTAPMTQEEKETLNAKLMNEIQKGRTNLDASYIKQMMALRAGAPSIAREDITAKSGVGTTPAPRPVAPPKDPTVSYTNQFLSQVRQHPVYKQLQDDMNNYDKALELFDQGKPISDVVGRDKFIKAFNPRITTAEQNAAKAAVPDGVRGRWDAIVSDLKSGKISEAARGDYQAVLGALRDAQSSRADALQNSTSGLAKKYHITPDSFRNDIAPYLFQKSTYVSPSQSYDGSTPVPAGGSPAMKQLRLQYLQKKAGQ